MGTILILIANASRARLCSLDRPRRRLAELADFVHPQGRQSGKALEGDRHGRAMHATSAGTRGHTAFEPRTEVHAKEREHFARELAHEADLALRARPGAGVVLVASSPFLGELRGQLGDAVARATVGSLPLDLSALSLHELAQRLPEIEALLPAA